MKARFFTVLMIIAMFSVLLGACSTPAATTAPAPTVASTGGGTLLTGQKAALISVQERGDRGVVDALVDGFLKGGVQYGYADTKIIVVSDPATYESTVRQVAEAGYNLIIATFPPMIDAVKAVAPSFPKTHFVLLDAALGTNMDNVQELFFLENESSYLAGVAAGMMTKTNKVGFIGGVVQDVINRYAVGFYEGAHAANSKVSVCWTYTNSLQDPAKGKEVALSYYNQGMDIIHAATAGTELGIYEASEQVKQFLIGADVDIIPLDPDYGLFATGPKFDQAAMLELKSHVDGSWKPGHQTFGLATGLVGITPFNQKLVPIEVQQAVLKAQQDIINGKIKVDDDRKLADFKNCS